MSGTADREIRVDPATMQTAAGLPDIKCMNETFVFDISEKKVLRELAARVAEIAADPVQEERVELWTKHNDLQTSQPVVFIDPENGWNECIPAATLACTAPMARAWEMFLRKQIYWFEQFQDDKVIEPYFDVPYSFSDTGWGVVLRKEGGENGGAYRVKQAVASYEEDFSQVHFPKIVIDEQESVQVLELAHELFDGTLVVRRKSSWWWTLGLTWSYINLRGFEDFLMDLIDEPEWVHRLMNLLCDGTLDMLDFLQEGGYLPQNTGGTYVGSGGFGFTRQLPARDAGMVTTRDMWGFVESQETSSVSPSMYAEFILPYHKKIMERFGLTCYGCCEAYDPRWKYVRELPRLRRVSVSPWASLDTISENLGKDYVASIKLNPAPLAQTVMNEDVVRHDIITALRASDGCIPEFVMKDNNTLGGNPHNAVRWVQMMREEIDRM
ncbi:MAG: uroporphyrinogen decarboxylase family protein [Micrococcales bacterium]|nr:uroporphyrinogen decarboxylase family protein [Micrococcales bacterium]